MKAFLSENKFEKDLIFSEKVFNVTFSLFSAPNKSKNIFLEITFLEVGILPVL